MAKVIEVPGQGLVSFPDSMSDNDIVSAISKLSAPQETTMGQDFARGAGLVARGIAPAATGAGAGFIVGGPPGAIAGTLALPLAELAVKGVNLALPENRQIASPQQAVEDLMTKLGLPVPTSTSERAIVAGSNALTGTASQLPGLSRLATTASTPVGQGIAGSMAQAPGRQLAAAAPASMAAQTVGEMTGSPTAGMVAGMVTGAPFSIGAKVPSTAPSREQLAVKSSGAFAKAEQSGIAFDPTKFNQNMAGIAVDMRKEGYTPTGYPKIEAAFKELTSSTQPKDFTELQALRKIIANAQASPDGTERRLASILKDRFDTYVANAPDADVIGTSTKDGLAAWKSARTEYSKMMKADIFDEMLNNAKLDASKFTQSGAENSMAQQLRQLAKNKNKMRMFTPSERDAITAAAKGGPTQNLLKFFGRFAPTGPVSSMFTGGATVYNPSIGVPVALGALGSRYAATQMRKSSIKNLADLMRQGNMPKQPINPVGIPAVLANRGLLSSTEPLNVTQEELSRIYGGQ